MAAAVSDGDTVTLFADGTAVAGATLKQGRVAALAEMAPAPVAALASRHFGGKIASFRFIARHWLRILCRRWPPRRRTSLYRLMRHRGDGLWKPTRRPVTARPRSFEFATRQRRIQQACGKTTRSE